MPFDILQWGETRLKMYGPEASHHIHKNYTWKFGFLLIPGQSRTSHLSVIYFLMH